MRIFDEILKEESRLNLTGISDIDLIVIPEHQAYRLLREYKKEFEIEDSVDFTFEDLQTYIGNRLIIVDDDQADSFKFYQEII